MARHQCTIHNSRDADTVSAAVATRSLTDLEPLFYRGRGITASDAVFTIIWHGFSAPNFFFLNEYADVLHYGDIGGRLAL